MTRCNMLKHSATFCNTPGLGDWDFVGSIQVLLQTAAHCNTLHCTATLQHTEPYCYTTQHTATHCNTLQHTATHPSEVTEVLWQVFGVCNTPVFRCCNTLQHTATHCNALQHTTPAAFCNTLQRTATYCTILKLTVTHCTILKHTLMRWLRSDGK